MISFKNYERKYPRMSVLCYGNRLQSQGLPYLSIRVSATSQWHDLDCSTIDYRVCADVYSLDLLIGQSVVFEFYF